jgi:hypothetical protein
MQLTESKRLDSHYTDTTAGLLAPTSDSSEPTIRILPYMVTGQATALAGHRFATRSSLSVSFPLDFVTVDVTT